MRCLILIALQVIAASSATAEAMHCADPRYRVESTSTDIAVRTCQSVSNARDLLASCGVQLPESLEVRIVDSIDSASGSCLGLYHCGEGRIDILSPDAMQARRASQGAFAGISDDALWQSVLVHELTHAAYQAVDCPFQSCIATDEYAAHVMQVLSLPKEERERFAEHVELKGAVNRDAISAIVYFMSPDRFAKYAWLHFQSQADPCGYMRSIMEGNVHFDRERP